VPNGAGFNSSGRFYEVSAALLGMTPRSYRAGGDGLVLRFAVGQCSLGAILVAATAKGVCAILLGDDPDALVREMQDRFRTAEFIGGDKGFEHWVAKVVGFVEAPALGLDLPLDVRGTAFQQRVWQALRAGGVERAGGEAAAQARGRSAAGEAGNEKSRLAGRGRLGIVAFVWV